MKSKSKNTRPTYLVLLVDRKRALMFNLLNGVASHFVKVKKEYVPQKVKHGDDTWDAQDKIFRHIEDHLHRHLSQIASQASHFAKYTSIDGVIIGSHKVLFAKVRKHLLYPLNRKVKGQFVTELKVPIQQIIQNAKKNIEKIERKAL